MVRKLLNTVLLGCLVALLATPLSAYSAQGYVKLYNHTDSELQVYLDGVLQGNVPTGISPSWIPTDYGLHKVEFYKTGSYSSCYKYCEISYSYPNANVEIGRYDL